MMKTSESTHVRNEPCPRCRERGNDRSGDNLGRYDDGHGYCWRCGYYEHGTTVNRITRLSQNPRPSPEDQVIVLPEDSDSYIPAVGRSWIGQYGITDHELVANRVMWSEYWQQLIFPYFDVYGNLVAYQARNFKVGHKQKWWSQGDLKSLFHVLPRQQTYDTIVVVEDIVSAIKVSRVIPAMPLFGNNLANRLKTLYKLTERVVIWLDPDMKQKSLGEAKKCQQIGLPSTIVFSDKDPKEHDPLEIKNYLTNEERYATL